MPKAKRVSAGLALAAIAIAFLVPPPVAAAPAPCSIDLTAADTAIEVTISSSASGTASATINYTVDKPAAARGSITVAASVDNGWIATVSPASITVTNQRTGTILLTVAVPAGTLASQVAAARVEAHMVAGGINCQGDSVEGFSVVPLPYFDGLTGKLEPRNVTLNKGLGSFTLTLGAKANVPVTLALEYGGPDGATFIGPSTVSIRINEEGTVNATETVQIRAPELPEGTYQLNVTVRATTSEGLSHQDTLLAPLIVPVRGDPPLTSTPVLALGALGAVGLGAVVWWKRR